MISNAKKAVIHIAKAQTGMTDQEYRDLLSSVDAASSKDLCDKTFSIVMKRFEDLGFQTTSKTRSKSRRKINNLPQGKRALMQKLEAIILDMDLSWGYVDAITKSRFKVEKAQWLHPPELKKLVIMMIYHQTRQKKKKEA